MAVKEFSFRVEPKQSDDYVKRSLKYNTDKYPIYKDDDRYEFIKTRSPDVEIVHGEHYRENNYMVFYKKKCTTLVAFEDIDVRDNKKMFRLFRRQGKTPHAITHPNFRGLGYVSFFYKLVLKKYVLVTETHSYWIDPHQMSVLAGPTGDALRVLSTTPIQEKS